MGGAEGREREGGAGKLTSEWLRGLVSDAGDESENVDRTWYRWTRV